VLDNELSKGEEGGTVISTTYIYLFTISICLSLP